MPNFDTKMSLRQLKPFFATFIHELLNSAGNVSFGVQIIEAELRESGPSPKDFLENIRATSKNVNNFVNLIRVLEGWVELLSDDKSSSESMLDMAKVLLDLHLTKYGDPAEQVEWRSLGKHSGLLVARSKSKGLFDLKRGSFALLLLEELFPDGLVTTVEEDSSIIINVNGFN